MLICVCHMEANKLTYLFAYLLTYLLNLSQHYDGNVDVMCNLPFAYFHAAIALQQSARLLPNLFYFIADICTCAINAAMYFIAH